MDALASATAAAIPSNTMAANATTPAPTISGIATNNASTGRRSPCHTGLRLRRCQLPNMVRRSRFTALPRTSDTSGRTALPSALSGPPPLSPGQPPGAALRLVNHEQPTGALAGIDRERIAPVPPIGQVSRPGSSGQRGPGQPLTSSATRPPCNRGGGRGSFGRLHESES